MCDFVTRVTMEWLKGVQKSILIAYKRIGLYANMTLILSSYLPGDNILTVYCFCRICHESNRFHFTNPLNLYAAACLQIEYGQVKKITT